MLRFEVSRSVITVQREFGAARFRKAAPCIVPESNLLDSLLPSFDYDFFFNLGVMF